MNDSWITTFSGTWQNEDGHTLIIRILDEEHAVVDFLQNGSPIKRPWCDNQPSIGMKASYDPRESPELDIDLGFDGFTLSLGHVFEDGKLVVSISRYETDMHLDQYYALLGKLGHYTKTVAEPKVEGNG